MSCSSPATTDSILRVFIVDTEGVARVQIRSAQQSFGDREAKLAASRESSRHGKGHGADHAAEAVLSDALAPGARTVALRYLRYPPAREVQFRGSQAAMFGGQKDV